MLSSNSYMMEQRPAITTEIRRMVFSKNFKKISFRSSRIRQYAQAAWEIAWQTGRRHQGGKGREHGNCRRGAWQRGSSSDYQRVALSWGQPVHSNSEDGSAQPPNSLISNVLVSCPSTSVFLTDFVNAYRGLLIKVQMNTEHTLVQAFADGRAGV